MHITTSYRVKSGAIIQCAYEGESYRGLVETVCIYHNEYAHEHPNYVYVSHEIYRAILKEIAALSNYSDLTSYRSVRMVCHSGEVTIVPSSDVDPHCPIFAGDGWEYQENAIGKIFEEIVLK